MPKVGKMKFPYTEQGMKEAASYAKNSGKPMQVEGNYGHGGMVPKYKHGGMVPKYQGGGMVPMGGPNVPLRRGAPRPPGQNAPQGFGAINWNDAPHYGPHRGNPIPPSVEVPGTSPVSPLPPGAGMRPPVNPGTMGGKMDPRMRKALMNRLANFKKRIV